ncbi:hypothetical protein [Aurantiacibacter suaedae]|uniref:hypothetical protein n=1 Tax=Aurantiacibacter suaedae TaxID=2545755 RepID=UPI0010F74C85|nr:hypothetical protein [Aurantiacibacter suaedae]
MNTHHTCGHDVRRANASALKLELGLTLGGKIASSVCFASVTGLDGPILEAAARRVAEERQDCVIAVYADDEAVTPEFYLLLLRHHFQVLASKVVPSSTGYDEPLVLMTEDRERQFAIDQRGMLSELPIEAATKKPRNHRRAADRIAATADAVRPLVSTGGQMPGDVFLNSRGVVTTAAVA